jgi:hypothetical protein
MTSVSDAKPSSGNGVGKMTYAVSLVNPEFKKVADDCGLIVDCDNKNITEVEIEYFAEQLVKECILTVLELKPEEGPTKVHNDIANKLAAKFGVLM